MFDSSLKSVLLICFLVHLMNLVEITSMPLVHLLSVIYLFIYIYICLQPLHLRVIIIIMDWQRLWQINEQIHLNVISPSVQGIMLQSSKVWRHLIILSIRTFEPHAVYTAAVRTCAKFQIVILSESEDREVWSFTQSHTNLSYLASVPNFRNKQ